jgi:hypothetical protein
LTQNTYKKNLKNHDKPIHNLKKKNQKTPPKNINEPETKNQPEIIFAFSRTLKVRKATNMNSPS